jgi:cell wall-associated NlpC family hydrolase
MLAGGIALLAGCATRFEAPGAALSDDGSAAARTIAFQDKSISPRNGGLMVSAGALQTGDILLSSAPSVFSLAIRAVTLAPVSHAAIYIGNEEIVEAVGSGIRRITANEALADNSVVVAFRHPRIEAPHAEAIRAFALAQVGRPYNHVGAVLQAPFSVQRRICELPLVPEAVRDGCIRGIGAIQLGAASNDRFFCSQFVLEAYRRAGLPMTKADPRLINPADLLHMREGDVPSIRSEQALEYIGHLKYRREV